MAFCLSGLQSRLRDTSISIQVMTSDPLIRLANLIDWQVVAQIADADLKKTTKGFWWSGRKMNPRTHFAIMILQTLLKSTDRGMETKVRQTPLFQVFCGQSIVANWKCPDNTKIETFRNRLTAATHKAIGDYVLKLAVEAGYANPCSVDIDSTVQEANMSYPSDATLMRKLAQKCAKIINFMKTAGKKYLPQNLSVDIKAIEKKAKEYFFLAKNAVMEKRRRIFKEYHALVTKQLLPAVEFCEGIKLNDMSQLPWNIKHTIKQVTTHSRQYLKDVAHFIKTHAIKKGKILAFHCFTVACIKKGKMGKEKEFGSVYQLGRIGGNFMVAYTSISVRMEDKKSLVAAVKEHGKIFGEGVLKDIATDKGYYSARNIRKVEALGISADGVQRPSRVKKKPAPESVIHLHNRRAGVEPLIGHVKEFGLRRSKMKSDPASLAHGYRCVMGFNLHQLTRNLAKAA